MVSGIVLYKDLNKIVLLKVKDDISDIDLDNIDQNDLEYYSLGYKSFNVGTDRQPDWVLALSNIREIEFADGINYDDFKELKAISQSWKNNTYQNDRIPAIREGKETNISANDVISEDALSAAVVQKNNDLNIKEFRFSKGGISNSKLEQNIAEIEEYAKKFQSLYNINFRILSEEEI